MKHTRSVPAALLALVFTAACESSDVPVGPEPADAAAGRAPQSFRTPDDEFARASRAEAPGFAGFYLREDGTPVIRLVDGSKRGEVQRYLAQELAAARRGRHADAPQQPVFVPAEHDFAQLKEWAEQLTPLMQSRGDVYLVDVDEVGNRVLLGVADATATGAVRAEAARLGIPASAVATQTQAAPQQRASLRDRQTTLKGGVQIAFGQYLCTLGFPATRNSTGASIFVTNAHCTGTQYASDGIAIYQNTVASGNQIGNEVADRALYACVSGVASCRQADAAYISNNGTRATARGLIARTAWATGANAGTTITGDFRIVARYTGSLPVGTSLDKTGRTSGSTYGNVTNSCVTIGSLRCQDISKVWSEGGDSGSPVYVWVSNNDVQLHGVMWGGPGTDYTTTYSSRLAGIEADLGALSNLCVSGC
ncbi:MAG TPA: hypothetical protein VF615_06385 [Longimicrobiaceae bacterium]|jgi:hypothetical protein